MKYFPRGTWGYAILLVVLFAIAAIATQRVVDFTAERFDAPEYAPAVQAFSLAIWLLTMGFMFLSGALGLLAISSTAEYETRHRLARIVNTMNSIADGLLVVDARGQIRGANAALRRLMPESFSGSRYPSLGAVFPELQADDLGKLLNPGNPCEIEIKRQSASGARMLRFRTQPAEGILLLFVSDITETHAAALRQQQAAKLQLLGRVAGGVAHDFCNILSAISGHAFLIRRFNGDKQSVEESSGVIMAETQRGVRLSRQLLALSRSSEYSVDLSANLPENLREVNELLRVALSSAWKIETESEGSFPSSSLSPVKIVQIVLNLGLLAADRCKQPGKLRIQLKRPEAVAADPERYAAVITVAVADADGPVAEPNLSSAVSGVMDTSGVIPSVVRTLVEDAGGRLDELYTGANSSFYRIFLPLATNAAPSSVTPLASVISGPVRLNRWHILVAGSCPQLQWLEDKLAALGAKVTRKETFKQFLDWIEAGDKPEVIVVDQAIFEGDSTGVLRLLRRLCPSSGIVVMCPRPDRERLRSEKGFDFVAPESDEDRWLDAVVRSREPFAT